MLMTIRQATTSGWLSWTVKREYNGTVSSWSLIWLAGNNLCQNRRQDIPISLMESSRMRMAITLLFLIISTCSWGKELPKLEGKPVLTISGKIENSNQNGAAVFDIAGLEKIGLVTMRTRNPWYNDQTSFEGIPMKKLMELVGAKGTVLSVTALNDYTTEIPIEDFTKYNVILAIKMNGQYMRVRDKGPLFIVYPYESNKELDNQVYYSRSAWQISKMVVE
ncbi:hypothetical protein EcWSU1_01134 [Enterobacter ludwigii]|uniref:Oxidoreductase molybdopterin-binding domain-containing protein n=2 Tax=Enterobacter ludwigii TaxID=299767 RepID=G8LDI6_9ENTR|nr:hypothetical protein EcWSU1_01134 [Enterobacter ludwigii]